MIHIFREQVCAVLESSWDPNQISEIRHDAIETVLSKRRKLAQNNHGTQIEARVLCCQVNVDVHLLKASSKFSELFFDIEGE
jgi:hypothetical protein